MVTVTTGNGQNQTQWSDDQHSLQLNRAPNKPLHLIARDQTGKEIFNGPVETPEQLKALPPGLEAKLAQAQATLPVDWSSYTPALAYLGVIAIFLLRPQGLISRQATRV